jgi:hypothetical protein
MYAFWDRLAEEEVNNPPLFRLHAWQVEARADNPGQHEERNRVRLNERLRWIWTLGWFEPLQVHVVALRGDQLDQENYRILLSETEAMI